MVHQFHCDQLKKMQFEIVFKVFLHHVGIHGPCQTLEIFSISFLLLYGVMAPKIFQLQKSLSNSSSNQNLTRTQQ